MNNFLSLITMVKGKKRLKKSALQDKGHRAEMNTLIETIRCKKSLPISFESLYTTALTTFKVYESLERNEMVKI